VPHNGEWMPASSIRRHKKRTRLRLWRQKQSEPGLVIPRSGSSERRGAPRMPTPRARAWHSWHSWPETEPNRRFAHNARPGAWHSWATPGTSLSDPANVLADNASSRVAPLWVSPIGGPLTHNGGNGVARGARLLLRASPCAPRRALLQEDNHLGGDGFAPADRVQAFIRLGLDADAGGVEGEQLGQAAADGLFVGA